MSLGRNSVFLLTGLFRIFSPLLLALLCFSAGFSGIALDPSFGTGGKVAIEFPPVGPSSSSDYYDSYCKKIFVQPQGRIVCAGDLTNWGIDGPAAGLALAGFSPAGTLDAGFGSNGTLRDWSAWGNKTLQDAHLYPDGKILRLWYSFGFGAVYPPANLVRMNADGSVDKSFSADINVPGLPMNPLRMSIGSDGKIVVVAWVHASTDTYYLFRLNPDGSRDAAFGTNGLFPLDVNRFPRPEFTGLKVLDDGKILLSGSLGPMVPPSYNYRYFFIVQLNPNGYPDRSFGNRGVLNVSFGSPFFVYGTAHDMVVQTDGRIMILGQIVETDTEADTFIARFGPRGKVDGSFGSMGVVIHDFAPGGNDSASAAVVSNDGKIRVAGIAGNMFLARFSSTGSLEDQISTIFTAGMGSGGRDLALQPDGKILVAGYTGNSNIPNYHVKFGIARYMESTGGKSILKVR